MVLPTNGLGEGGVPPQKTHNKAELLWRREIAMDGVNALRLTTKLLYLWEGKDDTYITDVQRFEHPQHIIAIFGDL